MFTPRLSDKLLAHFSRHFMYPLIGGRAEIPLRFVVAFVLLNLPFWLLGHWLFISRPWFNIELLAPLLVAAFSPMLGAVTLAFAWLLDLAVSQSLTFHFMSPLEFVRSASFVSRLNLASFLSASTVAVAAAFGTAAWLAFRCIRHRVLPWRSALAVVLILVVGDVGNGSSLLWQPAHRAVAVNVAGSPTITLLVRAWAARDPMPLTPLPRHSSAVERADLSGWAAMHPRGSILVLIVESMGLHHDARMRGWLRDQLYDDALSVRFSLAETQVPFAGSTTSAELRELCGLSGSYRSLLDEKSAGCLPERMAKQGWRTVGLHGFSKHMFDRMQWWPALGLKRQAFAEDILQPGDSICGGGFAGVCDAELIGLAVREARVPETLVYALTLNSHMPLADIEVPNDLNSICASTGNNPTVCQLTATIGVGLRALRAELLAVSGDSLAVVVVGDHAPPFSKLEMRGQYSQEDVAAFVLTPQ